MKKALALLLALIMPASSLIACGNGANPAPVTTTAAPGIDTNAPPAETTAPTHDAEGYLLDSLPADLNFEGAEIGILTRSDVEQPEFDVEEVPGEVVNDAIFKRNESVQQRLKQI